MRSPIINEIVPNCAVAAESVSQQVQAESLAKQLQLPCVDKTSKQFNCLLMVTAQRLELRLTADDAPGPVYADFMQGPVAHRRYYGGGRNQLLAKAIGLNRHPNLSVLDLTAGLGRDAFILCCLGAQVTMLERSAIIAVILQDGLQRADTILSIQKGSLQLIEKDSKKYIQNLPTVDYPDVIYLDPMFPHRSKSALVKKEMRVLREIVGDDQDAASLLDQSLQIAKKRVVVKRPRLAFQLSTATPSLVLKGKSSRFDIYCC